MLFNLEFSEYFVFFLFWGGMSDTQNVKWMKIVRFEFYWVVMTNVQKLKRIWMFYIRLIITFAHFLILMNLIQRIGCQN